MTNKYFDKLKLWLILHQIPITQLAPCAHCKNSTINGCYNKDTNNLVAQVKNDTLIQVKTYNTIPYPIKKNTIWFCVEFLKSPK